MSCLAPMLIFLQLFQLDFETLVCFFSHSQLVIKLIDLAFSVL
jgi:hypothetical protein